MLRCEILDVQGFDPAIHGMRNPKNSWDKSVQTVNVLAAPDITSIANNASVLTGQQVHTGKQKQSVFGMVSLGYKGMFVDATFRNDWSSTLPKANNSYFYASGSMSAVLTEIFPKIKSKTLAFAKLRGSIARVGNDSGFDQLINGYSYAGLFRNDMAWFSGETLRKNPNLKPETTISKEIGAEVRLLDGRLTADVTYYTKSTHDQIVRTSVSVFSNYQQIVINSGEISNKGWEISLSGSPIQTKNFEWKMLFNWSKNNSMVESLPEGMDKLEIGYGIGNVRSYAEVGKSYGALYAPTYKRDEEGYILCDIYGNPKENPEQIYVGNVQADWRGGFGNTFRWKNLSFSFMLDFQKAAFFHAVLFVNQRQISRDVVACVAFKPRDLVGQRAGVIHDFRDQLVFQLFRRLDNAFGNKASRRVFHVSCGDFIHFRFLHSLYPVCCFFCPNPAQKRPPIRAAFRGFFLERVFLRRIFQGSDFL